VSTVALVADRPRLERRARLLAWGGNAWHLIEFAIALAAGIAAGSVALVALPTHALDREEPSLPHHPPTPSLHPSNHARPRPQALLPRHLPMRAQKGRAHPS
jgi:hypothetical protein